MRVERRPPRRITPFREIELHDRLAERHVLHDLVHRRLVVQLVDDVAVDADVGGIEHRQHLAVGHAPRESHVVADAQLLRERLHLLERSAAAHQAEVDITAPEVEYDVAGGSQQVVDTLLLSHHADVADQVAAAALEPPVGRQDLQAFQTRPAAHDEHPFRRHPAALHRDAPVGLVGRNGYVRDPESPVLELEHQSMEEIAPAELCFVELGV